MDQHECRLAAAAPCQPPPVSLLSLSAEVLELVLAYLDVRSLAQTAQTCRALNALRWPVVDLRRLRLGPQFTPAVFTTLLRSRRPRALYLSGTLGCPKSGCVWLRRALCTRQPHPGGQCPVRVSHCVWRLLKVRPCCAVALPVRDQIGHRVHRAGSC